MVILVSGATVTVRRFRAEPNLGVLFVPSAQNRSAAALWPGAVWAADNGAFSQFDQRQFLLMLKDLRGVPGCRFVAAPDVVANAEATLRFYQLWQPMIRALGYPVALVGQDGLEPGAVPWSTVDALFIGGSTDWKLSRAAAGLVGYAKARGIWVHMGRVNSRRRLHYAERIGCDSIDGTCFSRWADRYIPKGLRWLDPLPLFQGADHART